MKKIFAVFLSVALALALAVPAFAAGNANSAAEDAKKVLEELQQTIDPAALRAALEAIFADLDIPDPAPSGLPEPIASIFSALEFVFTMLWDFISFPFQMAFASADIF